MTTRENLRDLQSRLTAKLNAAQARDTSASWLAVELGKSRFLIPLQDSGEIFPWTPAQAVPYTKPWFLGVVNLRGGLYGVVDFPDFLAQAASQPVQVDHERNELALMGCSLLAFSPTLGTNTVLIVDRLSGLRSADAFAQVEQTTDTGAVSFLGQIYTDSQGQSWQELRLSQLAQDTRFLEIAL